MLKVDPYWEAKVKEVYEATSWGAKRIEQHLDVLAEEEGRRNPPSMASIGRILRRHKHASEKERALYREFHWPQAMETSALPWEASRLAIELLEYYLQHHRTRPTIRRALWHWRVSLALPDLTVDEREEWVNVYLASQASGEPFPDLLDLKKRIDALPPSLKQAANIHAKRLAKREEKIPE